MIIILLQKLSSALQAIYEKLDALSHRLEAFLRNALYYERRGQ